MRLFDACRQTHGEPYGFHYKVGIGAWCQFREQYWQCASADCFVQGLQLGLEAVAISRLRALLIKKVPKELSCKKIV
jgi:hypothetical protein